MAQIFIDDWVCPVKQYTDLQANLYTTLSLGCSVKINNGRERFYVTVTQIDGDKIVGLIDNHLLKLGKLPYTYGDTVCFERKHIWHVHSQLDKLSISLKIQQFIEQQLALGVDKQELFESLSHLKRIVPSDES